MGHWRLSMGQALPVIGLTAAAGAAARLVDWYASRKPLSRPWEPTAHGTGRAARAGERLVPAMAGQVSRIRLLTTR